jgi:ribosome-associated translation inhibitor RaiA
MSTSPSPSDATVAQCLQLGHGYHADERDKVVEILHKIDHRLVGEPAERVRFDLMVKDREGKDAKTTLECHIAGLPTLVATSHDSDPWVAVAEVREELLRQLKETKNRAHPH